LIFAIFSAEPRRPRSSRFPVSAILNEDRADCAVLRRLEDLFYNVGDPIFSLRLAVSVEPNDFRRDQPYSPDLNPIEQLFAKLMALLRRAAERSVPVLWARIGELVELISADECRHYLAHGGYV
jgi:hypothetical protein